MCYETNINAPKPDSHKNDQGVHLGAQIKTAAPAATKQK